MTVITARRYSETSADALARYDARAATAYAVRRKPNSAQ
jgi:hypothetical protein